MSRIDYDRIIWDRNNMGGFNNTIGVKITKADYGYAAGELLLKEEHYNPIGAVHGGVVFTMCDTLGALAALTKGSFATTVSGNINYMNAVQDCRKLIGEGTSLKMGKNIAVVQVMIHNENGLDLACATMTYQYLGDRVPFPYYLPDGD